MPANKKKHCNWQVDTGCRPTGSSSGQADRLQNVMPQLLVTGHLDGQTASSLRGTSRQLRNSINYHDANRHEEGRAEHTKLTEHARGIVSEMSKLTAAPFCSLQERMHLLATAVGTLLSAIVDPNEHLIMMAHPPSRVAADKLRRLIAKVQRFAGEHEEFPNYNTFDDHSLDRIIRRSRRRWWQTRPRSVPSLDNEVLIFTVAWIYFSQVPISHPIFAKQPGDKRYWRAIFENDQVMTARSQRLNRGLEETSKQAIARRLAPIITLLRRFKEEIVTDALEYVTSYILESTVVRSPLLPRAFMFSLTSECEVASRCQADDTHSVELVEMNVTALGPTQLASLFLAVCGSRLRYFPFFEDLLSIVPDRSNALKSQIVRGLVHAESLKRTRLNQYVGLRLPLRLSMKHQEFPATTAGTTLNQRGAKDRIRRALLDAWEPEKIQ